MEAHRGAARATRPVAAALIAAVLVSACASTVQVGGVVARDQGIPLAGPAASPLPTSTMDPTAQDGPPSEAGPRAAPSSSIAAPPTAAPPHGGATATEPIATTESPSQGNTSTGSEATGRGYTEDEIYIGFATQKGLEEAFGSAGFDANFGDQEQLARDIIEDLNRRGGLAGRSIVPVFYDYASSDEQTNGEAACTRWTQDRPVFAVVNIINSATTTLDPCLAQRRTPQIAAHFAFRPSSWFTRHAPYLYAPSWVSIERLGPVWLDRASARGYFEPWDTARGASGVAPVKVGILSERHLHGQEFTAAMREQLRRHGVEVAATFEYSGQTSTVGTEMSSAVLRFRQAGVTHVVAQGILFGFALAAEGQGYRPRYTVSSIHLPNLFLGFVPQAQLAGAVGVGFSPVADVGNNRRSQDPSPAEAHCRNVVQGADQNDDRALAAAFACDGFQFLVAAIEAGGLSTEGMRAGAHAVPATPWASTFSIALPANRFDGASTVQDLAYRADCECFVYVDGTLHPM